MSDTRADYTWLWRRQDRPPLVAAHRGASGLAPENTMAAFSLAFELGAPVVECDVHLTRDGQPIIIHDATVDRTTDGSGPIAGLTLAEAQALDAGGWKGPQFAGQRLPRLEELLAASAGRSRVFVELKEGGGLPLVTAALAAIEAAPRTDVAIICFDAHMVRLVAERRPHLPLGFLVSQRNVAQTVQQLGPGAPAAASRNLGAGFFSPHQAAATPEVVAATHSAGLPVSAWTVDEEGRMQDLAALGVDAITTNRPDVALALFGPS